MKNLLLIPIIFSAMFSACVTTTGGGDISVNNQRSHSNQNLTRLEAAVIPVESGSGMTARTRQNEIAAVRQIITNMEREASADADYSGKLAAWSGRVAILEGRYSEAVRLHRQSNSVSQGNIAAVILGIRLEGDPTKRLEMIEKELALLGRNAAGIGELNIERGRALLELNRYPESAGAFDIAFSTLSKVYRESYEMERNRAWELRNTSGVTSGSIGLFGRENLNWNECISLIKNETQLFRFLTGGRNISDADLFNRLVERAFIPSVQDITLRDWGNTKPTLNETVTRAGAAWLLWHLHAESRADHGLLTRYSARYTTGANPRSPIPDVPPLSPFFDAILGCVETEFLSLPDGRNFRPAHFIRAAELLSVIKKIDK